MKKVLMSIVVIFAMASAFVATKDNIMVTAGDGRICEFMVFKNDGVYTVAFKTKIKVGYSQKTHNKSILIQNPNNDDDYIIADVSLFQTNDNGTYVYDVSKDYDIVRFLKRVNEAYIGYFGVDGKTYASDDFSLSGFTKSINSIKSLN